MKDIAEQATSFSEQVDNIVRIFKHGRRERVLFLIGFLWIALVNGLPYVVKDIPELKDFSGKVLPWLNLIAILPFAWGIWQIWKKATPREIIIPETTRPSVIKGPYAFGENDGDIFSQLGRESDLSKILGWVLDSQICFTALKGESGAGKTSLLRAGLAYTLDREKEKHGVVPIYWEAIPEEPAEGLLRAIHAACPDEKDRLRSLDDVVDEVSGSKKVIIIDQAEQLSPEKHTALFDLFKKIVAHKPPFTTTWIVAFREEYASTWFDFESTIPNFHPPKHPLKIFSQRQALENMAVLAEKSLLAPDNAVLQEMVNAMTEKGKVSPVEIGIGMMVLKELGESDSDISLGKFRDAGGVTGLLSTYIRGKLEDGIPEHEHSQVQNALLDLIDPETTHQRLSQGKSSLELSQKAQLPPNRMLRNLRYLASQNVRILEELPPKQQHRPGAMYRLAHERLIPALESLSGELLAAAQQAKRLLDDRFRTWDRVKMRKFLLSGRELRDVLKFRSHFHSATPPEQLKFIRKSKINRAITITIISILIFIALGAISWQPVNKVIVEPIKRERRLESIKNHQLVKINGGSFEMGDLSKSGEGNIDEKPRHRVQLDSFKMSACEITNQQYCDFLNSLDPSRKREKEWPYISDADGCKIKEIGGLFLIDDIMKDHPVVGISWFGAAAFANYLNENVLKQYKPCYDVNSDWS
ncbi:MAG: SUMF1/EgtB/PvdO family nonheme iron enzyme [Planctomycetes bacterium]|nr:SUMF1/EgtB/PvdO family nonheme iron enzyme [Planctomycetota bacterium]